MRPVPGLKAAPQIATTLRADILAGRITPGEALQQEDLAARFGVSRIPVRDALQQLAAARLVGGRRREMRDVA